MRFIFTCLGLCIATCLSAQIYVNAGEDQTVILSDQGVSLAATIDDTSNDDLNIKTNIPAKSRYQWKQVSGPSTASINSPRTLATTVNKLEVGTYEFEFSVSFREKIYGSDIVAVTVQRPKNQPPVANAGEDRTLTLPQNSLSIDGIASDSDGEIVQLGWIQVAGEKADMNQDGQLLILSNLKVGRYEFEFLVIDDDKSSDRDRVTVIVRDENKPPIVNAGIDLTVILPTNSTNLAGSATDDNNAIAGYRWRQTSGPSTANIVSPSRQTTRITDLIEGTYSFELVAFDRQEERGSDDVIITVKPAIPVPDNTPPTAKAGPDKTIQLPQNTVLLSGSGSDADGTIVAFFWTQTSGPNSADITESGNAQTTVTGLIEGDYVFELFVTDNGQKTDRDAMRVTVLAADTVPVVVVKPGNKLPEVDAGPSFSISSKSEVVTLQPSMSDPDGTISRFTWTRIAGPSNAEIDSLFQVKPTNGEFAEGTYTFQLTAFDNQGSAASDTVSVAVDFPGTPPNWPLIVAIVLGSVGVLAATKYVIGWVPLPKKVLVYYLDEAEESIVDSILPNAEKTESYSVGNSNSSDIKKLKEKNIAVHVLNTNHLVVNTPGRIQTYNLDKKKGFKRNVSRHSDSVTGNEMVNLVGIGPQQQSESPVATFPNYTIITLDGPLLPAYEKQLTEKGIQILQHVPINSYIIRVNDSNQLRALKEPAFKFIRMSQPYSPEDTGIIVRDQHFRNALDSEDALILDLLLHREDDMSTVLQFLEKLPITILEWYRNRIRISAPANAILSLQLPQHPSIQAIYEFIPHEWTNDVARQLIGIDKNIAGECAIIETGEGEIVGVADSGIDQKHVDLMYQVAKAVSWGRKKAKDTSDPIGHGTHVAASIAGNGAASGGKIKGMAPGTKLFFQSLINNKGKLTEFGLRLEELFQEAYDAGARIHNNSWGAPGESRYTIDTTVVDEFIYEHPEMLIVFAVGNNGCYDKKTAEKGYVGYGSISSPATMKNGLSVGASRNKRTTGGYADKSYGAVWKDRFPFPPTSMESVSGDPEGIAAFSARGQCDDYRMKPDIVAPGTDILSARSGDAPHDKFHGLCADYDDAYAYLGGTSMSAPIVAGAAALVREYYKKQRNCPKPSAALIKATLINGARKLSSVSAIHGGDIIPNANQGYGMLDMLNTIPNNQQQFQLHFRDSLSDPKVILKKGGEGFKTNVRLSSSSWIRVCLAFTDFPARGIQSDLDLIIEYNTTKEKWSGNRRINGEESKELRVADRTNNLEIVRLADAQPGSYTVHVIAHNLLNNTQGFALVITTGDLGAQFG